MRTKIPPQHYSCQVVVSKYSNAMMEKSTGHLIWNLFYKMMTVAFITGSVVSGTIIWQVWRFRESHPKAKPIQHTIVVGVGFKLLAL